MIQKFTFTVLLLFLSCSKQEKNTTLFQELNPKDTGVSFQNEITEGPNTNVLMYEYFYNGAGIALADFNGDQKLDLYMTSNMGENKMYLNKGNFEFEDITSIAQTQGRKGPWKTGVTAVDINGDQRMDLYVCYSGAVKEASRKNQLFLNMGNNEVGEPLFTETAALFGLDSPGYSNQGHFFDYDKDGDLDMILLNHNPKSLPVLSVAKTKVLLNEDDPMTGLRIYEQRNRYFYDVTQASKINGSSLSYGLGLALSDFNNDGWIDFYVSNDYTIPDYLYINDQKGGFENVLKNSMPHTSHFSMGNDTGDINNDGLMDLMTLDMLPEDNKRQKLLKAPDNYNLFDLNLKSGFHYQYMRNMLQKNNGDGTFSEIGQMMGVSNTDWSWSALFADYDNDGWQDLFISNGYKRDYTNRDFLNYMEDFIGTKNANLTREDVLEIINNMPASNVSNYIYANRAGERFVDQTEAWGLKSFKNSNGAAYGDLDNDGDLDLVVNNINLPLSIYKNNSQNQKNYLQIELLGDKANRLAIGSKVKIYTPKSFQTKEQFTSRGYLSSVSPILHFGLGNEKVIDSIIVEWPNGRNSKKTFLSANQRLTLDIKEATMLRSKKKPTKVWLQKKKNSIVFSHSIKNTLDFDRQKLLHYQPSFSGPAMIKEDLNQDGKEDIVIGGGKGQPIQIWIQNPKGEFSLIKNPVFELDKDAVATSISSIDIDRDGDMDLMVAHGGYHQLDPESGELSDRLYINNGTATFSKSNVQFDKEASSTTAVYDFNKDGYSDLFVGGGIVPGRYPERYPNKLWINNRKGGFDLDTIHSSLINDHDGIVRDALWEDLNQDGLKDLILVGEWMPVTVFITSKEGLIKKSDFFMDLKLKEGWWNRIVSSDLNKDGKPDFIIGNEGLNNSFKASGETPVEVYFNDFDQNGSLDPILSYYIGNQAYPLATRDELLSQMVSLKSIYPSYQSFSEATTASLLSNFSDLSTQKWKAITHESIILLSQETGYSIQSLPQIVQQSPLTAILPIDINQDGNQDLLLAGNRNKMALKIGQQDANFGMILMGDGLGNFDPVEPWKTGLNLKGDISEILAIGSDFYFGRCNQDLLTYQIKNNE